MKKNMPFLGTNNRYEMRLIRQKRQRMAIDGNRITVISYFGLASFGLSAI